MPVLANHKTEFDIQIEPLDALMNGSIRIQDDTAINQASYKKVFLKTEFFSESLVGFVREDEDLGKMWFINNIDNKENLVMDMALEAGDTFNIFYMSDCGIGSSEGEIATVVEVSMLEARKVITFNRGFGGGLICDSLKFIEGVGPNATLFFQNTFLNYQISGIAYKTCKMYQEDTLSFPYFSEFDLCGQPTALHEASKLIGKFSIIPNPNNGEFFLKSDNPDMEFKRLLFKIYDLNGKEIVSVDMGFNTYVKQLKQFAEFPVGLYFYKIIMDNKLFQSGKMIKK